MSDGAPGEPASLPPGYRLAPSNDLRRRQGGRTLIGGMPFRVLRLSEGGSKLVTSWFAGTPVGPSASHVALARRLLAAGMARGQAPPSADTNDAVTVVIPVKNDPQGLARTLSNVEGARVVVVDDGSDPPVSIKAPSSLVSVVRRNRSGGPAAARNTGLQQVSTPITLFMDAGVELDEGSLDELTSQLNDHAVFIAAPRVRSSAEHGSRRSLIERYETSRSPLDLGVEGGLAGPGRRLSYVPSACLLVRTDALREANGFDEALRYGEDVDLVWRVAAERSVLYHAGAVASHPPRQSLGDFVRQRVGYGSAAGPLGQRHGSVVAPVRSSAWSLAVAALVVSGHPIAGVGMAAATARTLATKLEPLPDARVEAAMLSSRGHWWTLRSVCQSSLRTWWPVSVLAIATGIGRKPVAVMAAAGWLQRLLDRPAEPVADLILGPLDDLSYGAGVWLGAWRERSPRALLPEVLNWSPAN